MGKGQPRHGEAPAEDHAADREQLRQLTRQAHEAAAGARQAARDAAKATAQLEQLIALAGKHLSAEICRFHEEEVQRHLGTLAESLQASYTRIEDELTARFMAVREVTAHVLGFKTHQELLEFIIGECKKQMIDMVNDLLAQTPASDMPTMVAAVLSAGLTAGVVGDAASIVPPEFPPLGGLEIEHVIRQRPDTAR